MDTSARRAAGPLLALGGLLPLAGVVNPPIIKIWGAPVDESMKILTKHLVAWQVSSWLIGLGIVAGVAAVVVLAATLGSGVARVGQALFVVGAAFSVTSMVFDLTVTAHFVGAGTRPDYYTVMQLWAGGLWDTGYGVLTPAAMVLLAVAGRRRRATPAWCAWVLGIGAAGLAGQFAFHDVAPFPEFLAFVAVGVALVRRARRSAAPVAAPPAGSANSTAEPAPITS